MPSVWHAEPSFLTGMGGSPCRQDVDRAPSPDGDPVDVARRRASKPGPPAFARMNSAAGPRRRDRGGLSFRIEPGSTGFYPATLAPVWTVGAFALGPLHLGRIAAADPVLLGPGTCRGVRAGAAGGPPDPLPGGAGQHGPRPCRPGLGAAAGPDHGSERIRPRSSSSVAPAYSAIPRHPLPAATARTRWPPSRRAT
jgi:hypothetical protein